MFIKINNNPDGKTKEKQKWILDRMKFQLKMKDEESWKWTRRKTKQTEEQKKYGWMQKHNNYYYWLRSSSSVIVGGLIHACVARNISCICLSCFEFVSVWLFIIRGADAQLFWLPNNWIKTRRRDELMHRSDRTHMTLKHDTQLHSVRSSNLENRQWTQIQLQAK